MPGILQFSNTGVSKLFPIPLERLHQRKGNTSTCRGNRCSLGLLCLHRDYCKRQRRESQCPSTHPAPVPEPSQLPRIKTSVRERSNDNTTGELQLPKASTAPKDLEQATTLAAQPESLPARISPAGAELIRDAARLCHSHAGAPSCARAPLQADRAEGAPAPPSTHGHPAHVSVHLLYRSPHRRQSGVERYSGAGSKPNSSRLSAARVARDGGENARRAAAEQGAKERRGTKIKGENKKSRKQYSKNSCSPGGRERSSVPALSRGTFLIVILSTYLRLQLAQGWVPAADTGPCSSCTGDGTTSALAGQTGRAFEMPGKPQFPATASPRAVGRDLPTGRDSSRFLLPAPPATRWNLWCSEAFTGKPALACCAFPLPVGQARWVG